MQNAESCDPVGCRGHWRHGFIEEYGRQPDERKNMKIASFKTPTVFLAAITAFLMSASASAQEMTAAQKYIEAIKKSSTVTPVAVDSFGDNLDLSSGSMTFKSTDIDIPGNNALPVRLQRALTVEDKYSGGGADIPGFGMAGGLDIPYIEGVFSTDGWEVSGAQPKARCSMYASPPDYYNLGSSDYWNGNWMNIPWVGNQAMLEDPSSVLPKMAGSAPIVTKDFWAFRCESSTKNNYPGEGFVAVSPQGEKYYFDWAVTRSYSAFSKRFANYAHSTAFLPRVKVYFYVTRIEDRSGNWVNYSYSGDKLQDITSSDGRFIHIDSWNGDEITSVSSSIGSWSYTYTANSMTTTQPDGTHWKYASTGDLRVTPVPPLSYYDGGQAPFCPEPEVSSGDYSLAITQPSGATATYTFTVIRHHTSNVPEMCNDFIDEQGMSYAYLTIPNFNDTLTLVSKSIAGSGLPAMQWSYSYLHEGPPGAFEAKCDVSPDTFVCPTTKITEVRGPNHAYKRYTFGNMFEKTSGQLMEVEEGYETGTAPNTQVTINKTTVNTYVSDTELANYPFPGKAGFTGSFHLDDAVMSLLRPLRQTQITLDGRTFTHAVNAFDVLARPTKVTDSSSPSP